jgi:Cof subfamily protein (haloacid dehalogenase superfamily)
MDLIFFDLDGTLLNKQSEISPYTKETLALLKENDVAFTVATGRTMLSARDIIKDHHFALPHIYSNGVAVWDPTNDALTLDNLLDDSELSTVLNCAVSNGITPFVNTVGSDHHHIIYHSATQHQVEEDLVNKYFARTKVTLLPLDTIPEKPQITNISMIGNAETIHQMWEYINGFDSLIAYSGPAIEGNEYSWMDVHHRMASKGSAVQNLKQHLGASNVICFGDSDNDMSMFELADECYAPSNAKPAIKAAASSIIGHHDEDGIARFLRERFSL